MTTSTNEAPVPSPCVGICCIGYDGLCFGCYRNRAELSAWGTASEAEKREILVRCRERLQQQALAPGDPFE
jgi:hypothetical protein